LTDAGFNSAVNPKDKVMLEFGISLSLMLILAFDAEVFMDHQTELQHQAKVTVNNPES